jgi:hypothetical protein
MAKTSVEARLQRLEARRRGREQPRGCYSPLCITLERTDDPDIFLLCYDYPGLGRAGDIFDESLAAALAPPWHPDGGPNIIKIILDPRWPPPDPDEIGDDDDEAGEESD